MADRTMTESDPRSRGKKPPFGENPPAAPGRETEMRTKPDHGEESYVGYRRLSGKCALITGGDSGIGRAVAIAFAREGANVAISYLPEEQEDADETGRWVRQAGQQILPLAAPDQFVGIPFMHQHQIRALEFPVQIEGVEIIKPAFQFRKGMMKALDSLCSGIRQEICQAPSVAGFEYVNRVSPRQQLRRDPTQEMSISVVPVGDQ